MIVTHLRVNCGNWGWLVNDACSTITYLGRIRVKAMPFHFTFTRSVHIYLFPCWSDFVKLTVYNWTLEINCIIFYHGYNGVILHELQSCSSTTLWRGWLTYEWQIQLVKWRVQEKRIRVIRVKTHSTHPPPPLPFPLTLQNTSALTSCRWLAFLAAEPSLPPPDPGGVRYQRYSTNKLPVISAMAMMEIPNNELLSSLSPGVMTRK